MKNLDSLAKSDTELSLEELHSAALTVVNYYPSQIKGYNYRGHFNGLTFLVAVDLNKTGTVKRAKVDLMYKSCLIKSSGKKSPYFQDVGELAKRTAA